MHVVPWNYDYSKEDYDGLFISNGPGDPSYAKNAVETLRTVSCYALISAITLFVYKKPLYKQPSSRQPKIVELQGKS